MECSICGKRFKRKKLAKEHMEAMHPGVNETEMIVDEEEKEIVEWIDNY